MEGKQFRCTLDIVRSFDDDFEILRHIEHCKGTNQSMLIQRSLQGMVELNR